MSHPQNQSPKSYMQKYGISFLMVGLLVVIIALMVPSFSRGAGMQAETLHPYVFVTHGKTLIIRDKIITISENGTGAIQVGDRVRTLAASTATIFWPDGSITRLGEKSSLKIQKMNVDASL